MLTRLNYFKDRSKISSPFLCVSTICRTGSSVSTIHYFSPKVGSTRPRSQTLEYFFFLVICYEPLITRHPFTYFFFLVSNESSNLGLILLLIGYILVV